MKLVTKNVVREFEQFFQKVRKSNQAERVYWLRQVDFAEIFHLFRDSLFTNFEEIEIKTSAASYGSLARIGDKQLQWQIQFEPNSVIARTDQRFLAALSSPKCSSGLPLRQEPAVRYLDPTPIFCVSKSSKS